jgi:TatD DNase family protein
MRTGSILLKRIPSSFLLVTIIFLSLRYTRSFSQLPKIRALSFSSVISAKMSAASLKFVDIGANLLDERFTEGSYNGKVRHEPDWDQVLQRSVDAGVTHIILTAGTLRESRRALELVRELRQRNETLTFGCTIGVHPTRCQQEFVDIEEENDPETILQELKKLAMDGQQDKSVLAIGEIGLDYDRLEFCPKDVQKEYFEKQLETFQSAPELEGLPLFLHNRNVGRDLAEVLKKDPKRCKGVVHSFDGTLELANEFIEMGLCIGLNGCSLKTEANLMVVKGLPLDKILLETDSPYCDVKATHAGFEFVKTKFESKNYKKFELGKMVKGRNEPCQIVQVAEVIAGAKGMTVEEVADACYKNSMKLYGFS